MSNKNNLQKRIGDLAFYVTQQKGTEKPNSGQYNLHFKKGGFYSCIVCDTPLFTSTHKFESHCGWPAFNASISDKIKGFKYSLRDFLISEWLLQIRGFFTLEDSSRELPPESTGFEIRFSNTVDFCLCYFILCYFILEDNIFLIKLTTTHLS